MAPPERPWLVIVLIVVVIIAGAAAAGYVYYRDRPAGPPNVRTVAVGDNVTVNYIGIFGSGPQQGRVFDTSFYSVATDGASWPKALEYTPRGEAANYTPLPVHVGPTTPSGGYSLGGKSYIGVVTGFWQGLLGLAGNTTRSVTVPANLGYGPTNPACVATYPLVEQFPVVETLTRSGFSTQFPGITPNLGSSFLDPNYRWTVLVLSSNASSVTLENLAQVGDTASPAGWPVEVTAVTSTPNGTGLITVTNELDPSQAGLILGHDFAGTGRCSSSAGGKFIVTAVNVGAGTYTADFNSEVTGQTLIFRVTVVDIYPPGTGGV
jgi:FKBP-type peptidyl-prolyl cis-trans isomerase 2